jgi:hypothetical protein
VNIYVRLELWFTKSIIVKVLMKSIRIFMKELERYETVLEDYIDTRRG